MPAARRKKCSEWSEGKPFEYLTKGCRRWQELCLSPGAVKVIAVLATAGHHGSRGAELSAMSLELRHAACKGSELLFSGLTSVRDSCLNDTKAVILKARQEESQELKYCFARCPSILLV